MSPSVISSEMQIPFFCKFSLPAVNKYFLYHELKNCRHSSSKSSIQKMREICIDLENNYEFLVMR